MIKREVCNFIKKDTLAQVFSCEFCEIFKNTFFTEHLRTTASICSKVKLWNDVNNNQIKLNLVYQHK